MNDGAEVERLLASLQTDAERCTPHLDRVRAMQDAAEGDGFEYGDRSTVAATLASETQWVRQQQARLEAKYAVEDYEY